MSHKVKKHHWFDGMLHTVEHFFDTLEEAMEHAMSSDAHAIKVYNHEGEIVHDTQNANVGKTYA